MVFRIVTDVAVLRVFSHIPIEVIGLGLEAEAVGIREEQ
jgi:hypothetical protein